MHTCQKGTTLKRLIEEIGYDATLALATHSGGQRIYVPPTMTLTHWLVDVVGLDNAVRLSYCFPGDSIYVSRDLLREQRNQQILSDSDLSIRQLVIKYGLCPSSIKKIRRKATGKNRGH